MWLFFLSVSFFQAGFVGCVRDLKLNEVPSQSPSHSAGVTPCYQQPLQPGVYFSSQGGYLTIGEPINQTRLRLNSERWCTAHLVYCASVMLDESLVLGRDLEIQLEVRLVSDSGLLLHTGAKKSQQLSLYLNQGQVTQPCAHTYTLNNLPITLSRLNHFLMRVQGMSTDAGREVV